MANMIDYLAWRGDLSLAESPFNEVDNLILCELSYVELADYLPSTKFVTVKAAWNIYRNGRNYNNRELQREALSLEAMAKSKRFSDAIIHGVRRNIDKQTQFAAYMISLSDGTEAIVFRGTDDAIIGWREDFSISFQETIAQELALSYMEECMEERLHKYRILGHSKGGNLAVYGAMMLSREKQKYILEIYSNDGPGICHELMNDMGYQAIRPKIKRFVPGFCVVGHLFELDVTPKIVKSKAKGIMQHDPLCWQVRGNQFVREGQISLECEKYNILFDKWIESASMEERECFTRSFFDALEVDGATNLSEIPQKGISGLGAILLSVIKSDEESKEIAAKFFSIAVSQVREAMRKRWQRLVHKGFVFRSK